MPREKVIVRSGFKRYARAFHESVKIGVEAGAKQGVRASESSAPVGPTPEEGVLYGSHLRDTYDTVVPGPGRRGWVGGFGSTDPNALWQELGTFGRRTRRARRTKNEIRRKFLRQEKPGRAVGVRAKRVMLKASKPALAATIAGIRAASPRRRFV